MQAREVQSRVSQPEGLEERTRVISYVVFAMQDKVDTACR